MRSPLLFLAALASAALPAAPLRAQGDGAGLTLPEVYRRLDETSPRLRMASARAEAARARIRPAGRWPDPELQLGLMNRDLPGFGLNEVLGMNQVQLMQMVPTAGKTGLAVRAARATAEAEDAAAREMRWEVRALGAMSFHEAHRASQELAAMREARRLLADLQQAALRMYASGEGRQADVLRAQVETARMDDDILAMEAMREGALARLAALLGVADSLPPLVAPALPESLPARDVLEALALANRPMLEAGAARVRAAESMRRMAGREIWPDLTVGVIYGNRPMPMGGWEHMASFMVGFSLPINPGSRQRQVEAEARAMTRMAAADLDEMRLETKARVGELQASYTRAMRSLRLTRSTLLPALEVSAASALAAYQEGGVDFMTVLDTRMAVTEARQGMARAESEAGIALAELEMLTATTLGEAP
jgi:cobalt-zinc-cadmium efflux system outer membrane protein